MSDVQMVRCFISYFLTDVYTAWSFHDLSRDTTRISAHPSVRINASLSYISLRSTPAEASNKRTTTTQNTIRMRTSNQ